MNLSNLDLLSLQTKQMQEDPTTVALCTALNPQFITIGDEIKSCLIYSRIDYLESDVLDELAFQIEMDWYDSTADIVIKRKLLKNALKVFRTRGTPYAVEQVIQDYFGDGYIEEWFDYDGDPYKFRVVTSNSSVTSELANQFTMAVNSVKNLRSVLEEIIIALSGDMNLYIAGIVHTGDNITVKQVV